MLVEKPREYTVRFDFLSREDAYGAISAHDAGFAYGHQGDELQQAGRQPLFERMNFGIHGDSRIAIVGKSACCCLPRNQLGC